MSGTNVAKGSVYPATPMENWKEIRALATEDQGALLLASDLVLNAYDFNNQSPTDLFKKFGNKWGTIQLKFLGGPDGGTDSVDGDTFGYTILGWAANASGGGAGNAPLWIAQSVAANDCLLGKMDTIVDPITGAVIANSHYADTLTLADNWDGVCQVSDAAGADRISLLRIKDLYGLKYLQIYIHGADGGSSAGEAMAIRVFGRTF